MADIRIRYGWVWTLFIAAMLIGAGLMTSDDPFRVRIGIGLLVGPWLVLTVLLGIYYLTTRSAAMLESSEEE